MIQQFNRLAVPVLLLALATFTLAVISGHANPILNKLNEVLN